MEKIAMLLLWFVPFIFSLSFHEAAHAWMANRLGDSTARFLGRMTLNPLAHVDPIGTVLFPILSFFTGVPLIGWAKPVPIIERNLKNNRWGGLLVAAAGPVSNMILALSFTVVLYLLNRIPESGAAVQAGVMVKQPLMMMAMGGMQLNIALAIFNLLPLPPLDGGRVFVGLFPELAGPLAVVERYGFIALLILFYTGIVNILVFYPTHLLFNHLMALAG